MKKSVKILALGVIILAAIYPANMHRVWADVSSNTSGQTSIEQQKAALEQQLQQLENQISGYNQQLAQTEAQKQTLNAKVEELNYQRDKLQLQIQSTTILLDDLQSQMSVVSAQIQTDDNKILRLQTDMSGILATIYEKDSKPIVESLLSSGGLAGYLNDQDNLNQLSSELDGLVTQTNSLKQNLVTQQSELQQQQNDQNNLLAIEALQNSSLSDNISQQNYILGKTKGREANYEAMISNTQAQAAQIRNQIYQLTGTSQQLTFGQAVDMAKQVSGLTGIEPSFLLAILTQESNLGRNVGTCNRAGDPPSKSWKVIMNPYRDQKPFVQITQELGMDTNTTPVSCPMYRWGRQIGWGGAMGPAQFIPSTWMAHRADVSAITGDNPANPWDLKDSFVAAALLLKSDGAVAGNENSEWAAAMDYFAGHVDLRYAFYGDNVMNIKHQYDSEIAAMNSN